MKRITLLFLSAVIAISMAGCSKKQTPAETYDAAVQKNAALDGLDMSSTTASTVHMEQQGIEFTQMVESDIKVTGLTSQKIQCLMSMKADIAQQAMDVTAFYSDGYYYVDAVGEKIKFAMDVDAIVKELEQSSGITEFTSTDLIELKAAASGENQVLTYKVSPDKMDAYMESLWENLGIDENLISDAKISAMSGETTINKEGYYISTKSIATMDMLLQGQKVSIDIDVAATINNPGQPVEITAPELDGYTEVDGSLYGA